MRRTSSGRPRPAERSNAWYLGVTGNARVARRTGRFGSISSTYGIHMCCAIESRCRSRSQCASRKGLDTEARPAAAGRVRGCGCG
eukprot:scaffold3723_cov112-Isochrysis_galbana.AAC.6